MTIKPPEEKLLKTVSIPICIRGESLERSGLTPFQIRHLAGPVLQDVCRLKFEPENENVPPDEYHSLSSHAEIGKLFFDRIRDSLRYAELDNNPEDQMDPNENLNITVSVLPEKKFPTPIDRVAARASDIINALLEAYKTFRDDPYLQQLSYQERVKTEEEVYGGFYRTLYNLLQ